MLTAIIPKIPMRNKAISRDYYVNQLGFTFIGSDYEHYLIVERDGLEIHLFKHDSLIPEENDGQVYIRCADIDALYAEFIEKGVAIHPNGKLETKPWGQREFSLLDPDFNLLTFGRSV